VTAALPLWIARPYDPHLAGEAIPALPVYTASDATHSRVRSRPTVRARRDHPHIGTLAHDQPLLWTTSEDRQLMPPERQLLEQIAAGELDHQLIPIADAVQARLELLHTVRSANALAELSIGDKVTFTAKVRPRYLEHELAVIESLDDRSVAVRLWRPVGRFGDGTVRCPPLALRKL
jgi:hypothetical protein